MWNRGFHIIKWVRKLINLFCEIKILLSSISKVLVIYRKNISFKKFNRKLNDNIAFYKVIYSRHPYLNLNDHKKQSSLISSYYYLFQSFWIIFVAPVIIRSPMSLIMVSLFNKRLFILSIIDNVYCMIEKNPKVEQ